MVLAQTAITANSKRSQIRTGKVKQLRGVRGTLQSRSLSWEGAAALAQRLHCQQAPQGARRPQMRPFPVLVIAAAATLFSFSPTARALRKVDVYIEDTDRFPGWKGELPQAELAGPTLGFGESGQVPAPAIAPSMPPASLSWGIVRHRGLPPASLRRSGRLGPTSGPARRSPAFLHLAIRCRDLRCGAVQRLTPCVRNPRI